MRNQWVSWSKKTAFVGWYANLKGATVDLPRMYAFADAVIALGKATEVYDLQRYTRRPQDGRQYLAPDYDAALFSSYGAYLEETYQQTGELHFLSWVSTLRRHRRRARSAFMTTPVGL